MEIGISYRVVLVCDPSHALNLLTVGKTWFEGCM